MRTGVEPSGGPSAGFGDPGAETFGVCEALSPPLALTQSSSFGSGAISFDLSFPLVFLDLASSKSFRLAVDPFPLSCFDLLRSPPPEA